MVNNSRNLSLALLVATLLAVAYLAFVGSQNSPPLGLLGDVHEHAGFKVYLDGEQFNFTNGKYMSEEGDLRSNFVHLHDMNGEILHKHVSGIRLKEFFGSIGMVFNSTCFVTDEKKAYCNSEGKTLKFFVNGGQNLQFGEYEFKDLDKLLISFGGESKADIALQLASISDNACIYSKKCPERGEPPDESTCATWENCKAIGG
ncbi:MAG: hypothetical protein AABX01_07115 [Candidatus Micrarchaeota archaeon]